MIRELAIKNFAIIDDLRIALPPGLTTLSGETGAGKSIIINAVNLLLGNRASARLIRTGADAAELEALFDVPASSPTAAEMAQQGLSASDGLLVRRIISRKDRHRVYINNRLSTMAALNALTASIASIAGQHAHQRLLQEEQHLLILDQFGGLMPLREAVGRCHGRLLPLMDRLGRLQNRKKHQAEHLELLQFQLQEIDQLNPVVGEDDALERERQRLKNAESLYQTAHHSIEALYGRDGAVVECLAEVGKQLSAVGRIAPELAEQGARLADLNAQIEDVTTELQSYLGRLEMDDQRLETVEARLDQLQKIKRKHGSTLQDVLSRREAIDAELQAIEDLDTTIAEVEAQCRDLRQDLITRSETLSCKRGQAAKRLARRVETELAELHMDQTRFEVAVTPLAAERGASPALMVDGSLLTPSGKDRAAFQISANPGEAVKPLSEIASGGELSRVILALKVILAVDESVGTLIFDEVDAGIGGAVAESVGQKIATLARHHQIICITHLPQIARFGDHHLKITKTVSNGRTHTALAPMDPEQRVMEIARMLGGRQITPKTIAHAKELLGRP